MLAKRQRDKLAAKPKRRNKRVHQEMVAEWDELEQENQLLKKLKKGKITEADYERMTSDLGDVKEEKGGDVSGSDDGLVADGGGSDSDLDMELASISKSKSNPHHVFLGKHRKGPSVPTGILKIDRPAKKNKKKNKGGGKKR